jgi:hypothetical protein
MISRAMAGTVGPQLVHEIALVHRLARWHDETVAPVPAAVKLFRRSVEQEQAPKPLASAVQLSQYCSTELVDNGVIRHQLSVKDHDRRLFEHGVGDPRAEAAELFLFRSEPVVLLNVQAAECLVRCSLQAGPLALVVSRAVVAGEIEELRF